MDEREYGFENDRSYDRLGGFNFIVTGKTR
jgi:hypothetical protein